MRGDFKAAKAAENDVLSVDFKNADAHYIKGKLFLFDRNYNAAIEEFEVVIALTPGFEAAHQGLAQAYYQKEDVKKVLTVLKKAKLKNKSDANRLFDAQIRLLIDQNRFNDALSICSERLSQNSKDVFALNLRGIIHSQQSNRVAARQDFEKAIALNPHWPAPHANMARLFLSKGDVQNAILSFESALQLNAAEINVYRDLARIYNVQKNYPKVIRVYEKALAVHPKMWTVANDLAFYLAEYSSRPEDLKRALALIRRARFHAPFNPNVEDTLAWIFYKQGHLKKARDTLEIVLNHHPDNPIFNYHMGTILEESGMRSAAWKKPYLVLVSKKKLLKDNMPHQCRID